MKWDRFVVCRYYKSPVLKVNHQNTLRILSFFVIVRLCKVAHQSELEHACSVSCVLDLLRIRIEIMHVTFLTVRYASFPNWRQKFCVLFSDGRVKKLTSSKKLFKIKNLSVFLFHRTEFALDHVLWHFLLSARMRKFSRPSWCEWIHLEISHSTKHDSSQVIFNLYLTSNTNVSSPTQCSKTAPSQVNFTSPDEQIIFDLLRRILENTINMPWWSSPARETIYVH